MTEAQRELLLADGHPLFDRTFRFNLSHRFPGIDRVARRLLSKYSILTPYVPGQAAQSVACPRLRCEVLPVGDAAPQGYETTKVTSYSVYRHAAGMGRLTFRNGRPTTPGVEVLCEGTVRFGMQWTLPVAHDYRPEEAPFDYFSRTGQFPIALSDVPGAHIPDIAEWFSEYLALREVEKWAGKAFGRRAAGYATPSQPRNTHGA
jgi:hypothetical protein